MIEPVEFKKKTVQGCHLTYRVGFLEASSSVERQFIIVTRKFTSVTEWESPKENSVSKRAPKQADFCQDGLFAKFILGRVTGYICFPI